VQTPTPVAPEPEPEVAQAPAASDNSSRHYYVVTDYTGDPSLNQARQAVGDAYVQNFPDGAKVRLGVFSDESRAEEMIQSLQQQGIPARIYQP
jgi:cell division septation protein DedD